MLERFSPGTHWHLDWCLTHSVNTRLTLDLLLVDSWLSVDQLVCIDKCLWKLVNGDANQVLIKMLLECQSRASFNTRPQMALVHMRTSVLPKNTMHPGPNLNFSGVLMTNHVHFVHPSTDISADILTIHSTDILVDILAECRPICWPT